MLFQGQEFSASTPFLFFADHHAELHKLVHEGRLEFLSQFRNLAHPELQFIQPDPGDPGAFESCKLPLGERESHAPVYRLHKDLLRLRRQDPVFRAQLPRAVDGAVLGEEAFVLRFFENPGGFDGNDRLLLVNLGRDLELDPAPEPLLAPPEDRRWGLLWSSDDPQYGGSGTAPFDHPGAWHLPGHAAVVMHPEPK
jgi:maltooligosyltrehalose trehalohydrolase